MLGQTISHYKILEKLGEGGMGVVYKAEDTKLDRIVALKFLPPHLTINDAERGRFLQEAKAAATLNHPNICVIHSIDEVDGTPFIVMEFVDGTTLRQKLPIQKQADALMYGIQIAEGLHEAHTKGIVHRDIKCDNIMVNSKNQIKIMDFGLAKLKGSLKLTKTSSTVGTLAYMAPEQIQGGDVDARSDIFSFGVVLFEMLTGELPFRGEHEAAVMYTILNEEAEQIEKYLPGASPVLSNIIQRCLEKDPANRYQSTADIAIELRRLQKQSTRVTRTMTREIPKYPVAAVPPTTEPVAAKKGNSFAVKIGIAGVVLLGFIGLVYKLFIAGPSSQGDHPFSSITISRLTTSGKGYAAAISPDGKYVVHGVLDGEKSSLVMRQVATMSNVVIVPPAEGGFQGVTFSIDGNYVYYVIFNHDNPNGGLYQIPVLGGSPKKILSDIITAITFSPDGKQIAFVRRNHGSGEEALTIANADGTGERKLRVLRGDDFFINGLGIAPAWSPDGKMIAISSSSNTGAQHTNLVGYSVIDGSKTLLCAENWRYIGRVAWLPDGTGLVLAALKRSSSNFQLWSVKYPAGTLESITNDLSEYNVGSLGITSDGGTIVAASGDSRSNIWVLNTSSIPRTQWDEGHAVQLTSGVATGDGASGIAWTPDDRIVYSSVTSGNVNLWSINSDGANQRQLTNTSYNNMYPVVSPDGRFILCSSQKDTTSHIYKMDIDGGNPVKLSLAEDYEPSISPDGKWVYYAGWATGKELIYRVPLAGGESACLSNNPAGDPRPSPDGTLLLCRYFDVPSQKWGNAILKSDNAAVQRSFTLPFSASTLSCLWSQDGKSITYVDTKNGVSNIWAMPVGGGEPVQLTHFNSMLIASSGYGWSRDGKYLAVSRSLSTSDVVLITEKK